MFRTFTRFPHCEVIRSPIPTYQVVQQVHFFIPFLQTQQTQDSVQYAHRYHSTSAKNFNPREDMDQHNGDAMTHCCAECGKEGGVSLKVCKACMLARYCSPTCQRNHWPKHKKECKQYVLPSYTMRLSSRILQPRRTVQFASYQCQQNY